MKWFNLKFLKLIENDSLLGGKKEICFAIKTDFYLTVQWETKCMANLCNENPFLFFKSLDLRKKYCDSVSSLSD